MQLQPHPAMMGCRGATWNLLDLAGSVKGSHTIGMLAASGTACSPKMTFLDSCPTQQHHWGSIKRLEMALKRQSHFFQPLRRNFSCWAEGAKPWRLPLLEHPSSKASCQNTCQCLWLGGQFWKALQRCCSSILLSPCKTHYQGSLKTDQNMRRKQCSLYTSSLPDRLACHCINL